MSRDMNLLHPKVKDLAEKLVKKCEKPGLIIKITDTVRTKEEQNALDSSVTQTKYPYSFHNWGLAFDVCQNVKGNAYPTDPNWWKQVGKIGKSLGLEWGGDWKGFVDRPHFQYNEFGTIAELRYKYGTPEKFFNHNDFKAPIITNSSKTWTSVVDYLVFKGFPMDFTYRKKLATKYGIKNYKGTAKQNTKLLKHLIADYGY